MPQSLNIDSLLYLPWVFFFHRKLAVPHLSIKNICEIDPRVLKEMGFKGIIFDKDNTLTIPYSNNFHPKTRQCINSYKEAFPEKLAIFSNSAGTLDDSYGFDAQQIELKLGIPVIPHKRKKPNGINDVLQHFNCHPHELVMIGDRAFTDIVFGNRHGLLTILTCQFTASGDNTAAQFAYKQENKIVGRWIKSGIKAPPQILLKESLLKKLYKAESDN
jgi:phosphatidylglycerophosphatase GEP4